MPRMALGVEYDGSAWNGWQSQPHSRTVQDVLDDALSRFLDEPVTTVCAGRTDTGVHALGQVAHVDASASRRLESWVRGTNALLPPSIAVRWAQPVPDTFHARFSAVSRTYIYVVRNARVRSPLLHARVGWVHQPLDLAHMRAAASPLAGEHDFSAFRSSQCQAHSPVRNLRRLDIAQRDEFFFFRFTANGFLHHMVRNLVGALLYVGQGREAPDWVRLLLQGRDRRLAAPTFSAAGLYFMGVEYPSGFELASLDAARDEPGLPGGRPPWDVACFDILD
ncbi:MAG TPA: tRNA pseudouridine(38-40) synthase TruA [Burkholderiaceae bacterium]|nr:tRNA pseudouridine(38-40) synthase TruA [Burkholderiaceae bacterium]